MQFAILGPLEVTRDGHPLALGGLKQRALLAVLLLHANTPVSRDRLLDALWGEQPPPSAHQTLDTYLYRLRKLLGRERIVRRPGGYLLTVGPDELDLFRFERLVADAHAAWTADDARAAAALFREALELWRGHALGDLQYEPVAGEAAERLDQRRLLALEGRIEADLSIGQGAELVPELERHVHEHPLRERMVGQLMVALYRGGRQADALGLLQAYRLRVAEELGLEPGPELRALERRILQQDLALAAPSPHRSRRSRPARRKLLLAGGAAGAAGIAVAILLAGGTGSPPAASAGNTNILVALNARSGRMSPPIQLEGQPAALTVGSGSVWVADAGAGMISRVDPISGEVVDRLAVGGEPGSVVIGGGAIWTASTLGATVERIDQATESITQTIHLGGANPVSIAFGGGMLWVADSTDHALLEVEPGSGSVRRTFPLDTRPNSLAYCAGMLWVASYTADVVEEVDPTSGQEIATLEVGDGPAALSCEDGGLWVANSLDGTVSRIDTERVSVVATVPVGSDPAALASGSDAVWVANEYSGSVSRIDPRTNSVTATISVGGRPASLAVGEGRVWIGSSATGAGHRGGVLTLLTTNHIASIDPALYDAANGFMFMRLAYDTLVTFAPSAGPAGLRLVPDLAVQLPVSTNEGTVYTFRVRPRIRYSDGRPLRASDFRRAIERLFRIGSPGTDYYSGIVGATACLHHPKRCDLARGVVVDDTTGTISFHLTAPDPDFLYKLTPYGFSAPIPPRIPERGVGDQAVPGTGPYRIAAVSDRGIRFERNRYFHEWSHAAQPNGNPDVIVWRYSPSHESTVEAIENGRADWTFDLLPPAKLHRLQIRHPALLHVSPAFIVEFVHLNTHAAPFNDLRVRRALNYAIDRTRIARWYGGTAVATPTCQPLVPGMPGYRRYCPYTLHPHPNGQWSASDLARAQELVANSGTRGERIDVWGATDETAVPTQEPAYIADVLRSLGYRTRLHLAPFATITEAMRRKHQLSADGDWIPDYPDPSSYIPQFFACNGGNGNRYYCNPTIDRTMRRATLLELRDPKQADALWTSVDHALTDQAAWVPTVDLRAVELVSKRVRNYQYSPVWGFIPDQVWLR